MKVAIANSIRAQIVFALIGTLGLLLFGAIVVLDRLIVFRLRAEFDHGMFNKVHALQSLANWNGERVDFNFADEYMPEFGRRGPQAYFELWRTDGRRVELSESLHGADLLPQVPEASELGYRSVTLPDGAPGRMLVARFAAQWADGVGKQSDLPSRPNALADPPQLALAVADRIAPVESLISEWRWAAAIVMLLALVLAVIMSRSIGNRALARLEEVAQRISALDHSHLGTRIPLSDVPPELRRIVGRINQLLNRLQAAFERERDFVSDVAHELRTPIAELRVLCDVERQWPSPQTPPEAIASVSESVRQMERMVTVLLSLARMDSGPTMQCLETIDLVGYCRTEIARHRETAIRRGLKIRLLAPDRLSVVVDRGMMELALTNIIGNALGHAPIRSHVILQIAHTTDLASVTTINAAPELRALDLQHLFERFWRRDAARRGDGHLGLGLSLVRAVAQVCGWTHHAALDRRSRLRIAIHGLRVPPGA